MSFVKGYIPWNKGKTSWNKGVKCPWSAKNGFKKGKQPWNKGIPMSEKSKKKLSISKTGKPMSQTTKDKISKANTQNILLLGNCNALGKTWKLSSEVLSKGNKSWFKKGDYRERNLRWIPDRTKLVKNEHKHLDGQYREWMFAVKKRDNWKCKISNSDCRGLLESHHILNWKQYPELRYDINNGITLCQTHHPRGRDKESELSPYFKKLVAEMQ